MRYSVFLAAGLLLSTQANAQTDVTTVEEKALPPLQVEEVATQTVVPAATVVLPADTIIQVTPVDEISSKGMKEGTVRTLQVAADATQDGVVVIPRGALVKAKVVWRTGKGIGGKSAKFELAFESVSVNGKNYALKGQHRQEGRGNTVGALLGSMIITGRSAVMASGQIVNAFTAEAIPAPS